MTRAKLLFHSLWYSVQITSPKYWMWNSILMKYFRYKLHGSLILDVVHGYPLKRDFAWARFPIFQRGNQSKTHFQDTTTKKLAYRRCNLNRNGKLIYFGKRFSTVLYLYLKSLEVFPFRLTHFISFRCFYCWKIYSMKSNCYNSF